MPPDDPDYEMPPWLLDPDDPNYQPQPEPPPPPPPAQAARATATYTVTATPAKAMIYDANGNLINDGERTYRWDAENRLVQIVGTYGRTEFEYDGLSRRVKLTERDQSGLHTLAERRFGWEGTAIAEERDASDDVVKRFWGLGETRYVTINNEPSTLKLTYTRDHLGSIREVLDETCAIRARYAYDEWGERTKVGGNLECDFGFTGHFEHEPSGITLAPYRGYDARIGRWLSPDPIGEAGGLNLYQYALNDPINLIDPDGLSPAWADMRSLPNYTGPSTMNPAPMPPGSTGILGSVAGVFFEPLDWVMTAIEIARDPTSPSSYVGAIPFIPSGAGKLCKAAKWGGNAENLSGGAVTAADALAAGEKWLGPGYREIAPGVFRSADDTRQFRMTTSDLTDPRQGPHVHFEIPTENSHVGILDP